MSRTFASSATPPIDDPTRELLAGGALGDLSPDEATPTATATQSPFAHERAALESAVGSLFLSMASRTPDHAEAATPVAPGAAAIKSVPADVLTRLYRLADAFTAARAGPPIAFEPRPQPRAAFPVSATRPQWGRWALAASLVLAAAGWIVALQAPAPTRAPGPATVRAAVLQQPDAVTIRWGEWSDQAVKAEILNVTGEVVWSDTAQTGVMRFASLPDLPDSVYQLWIIDEQRGMSQRVSGAIFEGGPDSVVTIRPDILIHKAAAFAVTIEQPGGTWVSDMTRRVVIAARPS